MDGNDSLRGRHKLNEVALMLQGTKGKKKSGGWVGGWMER